MDDQDKTSDLFHDDFNQEKLAKLEAEVDKRSAQETNDGSLEETVRADDVSDSTWQPPKYQMAMGGVFFAICVSVVVYGLARLALGRPENPLEQIDTEVYRAPTDLGTTDIIDFARFLVPFPDEDDRTYLLLSISVKPSNRDVYKEINEKKTFCRGGIYAGLRKAIGASKKKMLSGVELKRYILDAFEGMLASGTLQDVYFTEFLVE
jgi:flagellar basal body-associated protein FliL